MGDGTGYARYLRYRGARRFQVAIISQRKNQTIFYCDGSNSDRDRSDDCSSDGRREDGIAHDHGCVGKSTVGGETKVVKGLCEFRTDEGREG